MMSPVMQLESRFIVLWSILMSCALAVVGLAEQPKSAMVYKKTGGVEILADVYAPKGGVLRPAVLWIHGGALMIGSRNSIPPQIIGLCRRENYALVSIDYRLAPETKLFEIVKDLADAMRWIRNDGPKLFQSDPGKLAVIGASAGGYLAMMSAVLPETEPPNAIVSCWGYGDILGNWCTKPNSKYGGQKPGPTREEAFAKIGDKAITSTGKEDYPDRAALFFYMKRNGLWTEIVSGLNPVQDRGKLIPYCPQRNVSAEYPPLLMLHGTADPDVPVEQSIAMHEAMKKAGASSELVLVEGGGHGLWGGDKEKIQAAFDRSLEFIKHHLTSQ